MSVQVPLESRILVIGGAYGSGKSEVTLNLAEALAKTESAVLLADLDFVNPYFRSREWEGRLADNIKIISTSEGFQQADLPAISAAVAAGIRLGRDPLLIDLGGDPVGAKVLRRFADEPELQKAQFWVVVNPYRPFTSSPEQISSLVKRLEEAAGLRVTGLIANPNLLEETRFENIQKGLDPVQKAGEAIGLPVKFLAISYELYLEKKDSLEGLAESASLTLFPLKRHLLPPW
ncbi:MAG: hypothetical protein H0Z38_03120 [Firmicutes bacterium]|nr:hypothetical protein [Bacillota bacterium]